MHFDMMVLQFAPLTALTATWVAILLLTAIYAAAMKNDNTNDLRKQCSTLRKCEQRNCVANNLASFSSSHERTCPHNVAVQRKQWSWGYGRVRVAAEHFRLSALKDLRVGQRNSWGKRKGISRYWRDWMRETRRLVKCMTCCFTAMLTV